MKRQVTAFIASGVILFTIPSASKEVDSAPIVEFNEQVETANLLINPKFKALQNDFNKQVAKNSINKIKEDRIRQQESQEKNRIKNVGFNSYDVTVPSGITYEEMKEILSESHYSNFAELSNAFVEAEKTYKVNAFALVAIAGLESGWNKSDRATNGSNNLTGMAVYGDDSPGTQYSSKEHCIYDLAKQLKNNYLTQGGSFYNGVSTSEINIKYSANRSWYKQIDTIGDELVYIYNQKFRDGGAY